MEKLPSFFSETAREWFSETLGEPTLVQTEAWPSIHNGMNTLASAPTGTDKTLTAFLAFLDDYICRSVEGTLPDCLQLIYISPLKSLASDIRENLKRPMDGIYRLETEKHPGLVNRVKVCIRTGDTTQKERQAMIKHPPHILITTPESLYLLLTGTAGRKMLSTAQAVIIDELHSISVITFVEGRKMAEQLAMYMRDLGGEDFARVHHGSLSKEQRSIVEQDLKQGRIRLLIATSSMELGIDVGEIDRVFQVGCPRTISGTMQRLGRAGHSPTKTSVMQIYPRTAQEALYCGMTAEVARSGGIEHSKPFSDITPEEVRAVLRMLAGDYEHEDNVPVRPRLIYDRIHDTVEGDAYSRMLSIAAGGTIPDRGMFTVKTESGIKVGEVEEEFVFECRVGDDFQLGSFHWRVQKITKDTLVVIPSATKRDRLPFWKGEITGRKKMTGIAFGKILSDLEQAYHSNRLEEALTDLGLDDKCTEDAAAYIDRQIKATEILPNDRCIIVEHYQDEDGNYQMMVHSVFGKCVNEPLAILLQHYATEEMSSTVAYVSDDDGLVLFSYDGLQLPNNLIYRIRNDIIDELLDALVIETPSFNIMFRYNAGRALMMGVSKLKRQPLWLQRIKGSEMLERAIKYPDHPLIIETKRECLEDFWDREGLRELLEDIADNKIEVREIFTAIPSPMSFLLRKKTEESMMYEYSPNTKGVWRAEEAKLKEIKEMIDPDTYQLKKVQERRSMPEDEKQLHTLLMIEGDLLAGELPIPAVWLQKLMQQELVLFIEPGLFIAAEQAELYDLALLQKDRNALTKVILRLIRYRGGQTAEDVILRYQKDDTNAVEFHDLIFEILSGLLQKDQLVRQGEIYYHKELYDRAVTATVKSRREQVETQPFEGYAAYLQNTMSIVATPAEQLTYAVELLCGQAFPAENWEEIIFPARVNGYRPELLDTLLSQGKYYWKLNSDGTLSFYRYEEADWEQDTINIALTEREEAIISVLRKRGASFAKI